MSILKSIIKAALNEKFTTEAISEKRLAKCETCEFRKDDTCTACKCFIDLKAEMDYNRNPLKGFRIEKTHCVKGKWPFLDDEGKEHENDLEIANYYKNL